MPNFAIRDDDTSFFTSPDELEAVYSGFFGRVPIALAIVPYSVPQHRFKTFDPTRDSHEQLALGSNKELVTWLRKKIKLGHVDVMLHGYNHQYKFINGKWFGEYRWKSREQLLDETYKGKSYLEQLLDVPIEIFVPPSNSISKSGVAAIRQAGLNLSGIMGRGFDRPFTLGYPYAYFKRWMWRLFNGDAYPYPISLGGIKELRAYPLTPGVHRDNLLSQIASCAVLKAPFVVATHYWEFQQSEAMHTILADLINAAELYDFSFNPISSCYD